MKKNDPGGSSAPSGGRHQTDRHASHSGQPSRGNATSQGATTSAAGGGGGGVGSGGGGYIRPPPAPPSTSHPEKTSPNYITQIASTSSSSSPEENRPTLEEQFGTIPPARFGHTTTIVGNSRVVLFGGATGEAGSYHITSDLFIFDASEKRWEQFHPQGSPPAARAAHAATCVENWQLVTYGGATGEGTLASDELYLLDFRNDVANWMLVPVTGKTPGRRYGHSMVCMKPHLILFGGNNGTTTDNNIFWLSVEETPFRWNRVQLTPSPSSSSAKVAQPCARVYHAAEICVQGPASGMMVVFGGRTSHNKSLNDTWGLRQHRDGRWDWVEAPTKRDIQPIPRFQHATYFYGSKLIVVGGRGDDVTKALPTSFYDTLTCEWGNLPTINRFRHSCWGFGPFLYCYGGFDHEKTSLPTADLQLFNLSSVPELFDPQQQMAAVPNPSVPSSATSSASIPTRRSDDHLDRHPQHYYDGSEGGGGATKTPARAQTPQRMTGNSSHSQAGVTPQLGARSHTPPRRPNSSSLSHRSRYRGTGTFDTKVAHQVYVVEQQHALPGGAADNNERLFSNLVRKISIDKLVDEGKKLFVKDHQNVKTHRGGVDLASIKEDSEYLALSPQDKILVKLLYRFLAASDEGGGDHRDYRFIASDEFLLTADEIISLCDEVCAMLKQEQMVLPLRAPVKIYGDLHGQLLDLLQMFFWYGAPVESSEHDKGDLDIYDYLFLGDYVDRGSYSLEIICLLFSLKLRYPGRIHMIRGNHEDETINYTYGFKDECERRIPYRMSNGRYAIGEDASSHDSCYNHFNRCFEWLPVGALIESNILCIHGGIGGHIKSIEDIATIKRPLRVAQIPQTHDEQKVTDLLWSDPTDGDSIEGVTINETRDPEGTGRIVKFGPDRVAEFLEANNLQMIIRAHECVMDGFERFAGGHLITLFSATDYCGHHKNAGALLCVNRALTIIPKIIYPAAIPQDSWNETITAERPPTPPRAVPRAKRDELMYGT